MSSPHSKDPLRAPVLCIPCKVQGLWCNGNSPCNFCESAPSDCVISPLKFARISSQRLSSGSACETCRRRKTKCDGKDPCGYCTMSGHLCVHTSDRWKRQGLSDTEDLERRLRSLERVVRKLLQPVDKGGLEGTREEESVDGKLHPMGFSAAEEERGTSSPLSNPTHDRRPNKPRHEVVTASITPPTPSEARPVLFSSSPPNTLQPIPQMQYPQLPVALPSPFFSAEPKVALLKPFSPPLDSPLNSALDCMVRVPLTRKLREVLD
ncbi:uncharacterized protein VTP21DRAFT_10988 [Calcarisporiella thermophila]|uniref:uncharacterized protein n=1 Tax=Calcarisporiella thermophila TaxID=911321 RepID=UPI0037432FA7